MGVPLQMQRVIYDHRSKRHAAFLEQAARATPAAGAKDETKPNVNAAAAAQGETLSSPKPRSFKSVKSPYDGGLVRKSLGYSEHGQRRNRLIIPGIFPTGIDFEQLRTDREKIVFNRMSARYSELKALPGTLAHWDTSKDSMEPDDTAKRKAIIEMKSLALYSKQRALRDRIGRQMLHYDNLAMTTNRSQYRRMKKQSVREARITEKLEKQQRDMRENRDKKRQSEWFAAIGQAKHDIESAAQARRSNTQKMSRLMYNH